MCAKKAGRCSTTRLLNEPPMKWLELCIKVPEEFVEPVSYLFTRYGRALSVEKADGGHVVMRTYLPATSQEQKARIEVGVRLIASLRPISELHVRPVEEVDWKEAWKRHFHLLRVGRSLVIKPTWIQYQAQPGELVVELDPGMAFGTGHHPSTRTCLEALEEHMNQGMRVLDLGTGSGILTMAAIKLGAESVVALDIDPTAVKVARQNFRDNGASSRVSLARGTIPHSLTRDKLFDLVVANITARVIKEKAPHLLEALAPGGILIVSGIIEEQRQTVEATLLSLGLSYLKTRSLDDWATLVFTRTR